VPAEVDTPEAEPARDRDVLGGELDEEGPPLVGRGTVSLDEREQLVIAAEPGLEPFVERVTFTLPAIASALDVVYLVAGADKAEAVERAFAQPPAKETPSSLARGKRTRVFLDQAAAARL
jgi:6-phosphogluconolactonase